MLYQLSYLGSGRTDVVPPERLAIPANPANQDRDVTFTPAELLSGASSSSSGGGPGIA